MNRINTLNFKLISVALLLTFYVIVQIFGNEGLILYFNSFRTPFLDVFFESITYLGDGIFSVIVGVAFLCFISLKKGLTILLSYAFSGIFVQVLKQYVFTNAHRPWMELHQKFPQLILPDNFVPFSNNSFPSGHSASIYGLCFLIAMFYPKKWTFIAIITAGLVGFSRIYLLQHYPIDVIWGGMIGMLISLLVYIFFYQSQVKIKDSPLINLSKNNA